MSERSHFPLAKIKHFTTSCQILIRRKLAEEYHFPKQTGQVFLLFWVACPTLSPSPALISSSVISSCLNANSKGARAVFHSNRSFVIKEGGGSPTQAGLVHRQWLSVVWNREDEVSGFASTPGSDPKACQHPHALADASPSSIYEPDLTKTISEFLACSRCYWLKKKERKQERKKTDREQSTKRCRGRQQPTQGNFGGEREEASSASTSTPVLQSLLSR